MLDYLVLGVEVWSSEAIKVDTFANMAEKLKTILRFCFKHKFFFLERKQIQLILVLFKVIVKTILQK